MNKIKKALLSASILMAFLELAVGQAQTNTPPQSFFTSIGEYFTTFNTNLMTFRESDNIDVYTGPEYQQGINIDNLFVIHWNAIDPSPSTRLFVGPAIRTAGIAGTLVSVNADIGIAFVKYDTKFCLGVSPGYSWDKNKPNIGVYVEGDKALTDNTYAGTRLEYQAYFEKNQSPDAPLFSILLGFKF